MAHNHFGLRASACLEPAGVAWPACERSSLSGGDRVMIFGGGPIALPGRNGAPLRLDAVTTVIESLDIRKEHLTHYEQLISENCKALIKLKE